MEKELLSLPPQQLLEALKVDSIKRYNHLFSRLCENGTSGEFRKRNIRWAKKDLSDEEALTISGLEFYLTGSLGKTERWLSSLSDPSNQSVEQIKVKASWLTNQMRYFQNHPELVAVKDFRAVKNFDFGIFNKWIEEQGNKDKKLDICKWIQSRFHYFPDGSVIRKEVEEAVKYLQNHPDMHPIEQGAYLWYEIVRIHISHEANKRTGKALGACIFLANGYLPPKISKEDSKEYVKLLQEGFTRQDGHVLFTQFVARKILETQKEYANLSV